jgi:predicted RNase H-like HicB family nuclease
MRYAVIIEKGEQNYSAYVPDLPGCAAAAETLDETLRLMREAIEFHIEGLLRDGDPVPPPSTICDYVEVASQTAS